MTLFFLGPPKKTMANVASIGDGCDADTSGVVLVVQLHSQPRQSVEGTLWYTKNHGKSPFTIGKSTMGHVQ